MAQNPDQQMVSIKDLRSNLAEYINMAKEGKEIMVTSHGRPQVKMISAIEKKKRIIGLMKGQIPQIPEDAWEFPDYLTDMMEGKAE